jgi:AcrR family transcriptional regulator
MKSTHKLTPRKQPKQRSAEQRVAEIIAAYRRLLNGNSTRTNHVAAEAGVPISSLYQYFPNAEALAFAVY